MKTFMKIFEALNKPYKWKNKKNVASGDKSFVFKTDNEDKLEVAFVMGMSGAVEIYFVRGGKRKTNLTGEGDAFRILATVKEIVQSNLDFLNTYDTIYFTAHNYEKSRVRLYKRFIKELNKIINKKTVKIINYEEENEVFFIATDIKNLDIDEFILDI